MCVLCVCVCVCVMCVCVLWVCAQGLNGQLITKENCKHTSNVSVVDKTVKLQIVLHWQVLYCAVM